MEAQEIVQRYNKLKTEKATFDNYYQQVGDYCNPNSADFNRLYYPGEDREREIYDQTAQMSIDISSSSLLGIVANPATRWFFIEMSDEELNRDAEVMDWAETAAQITLNNINRPESGFYASLKSALVSTLCYGTPAMLLQEAPDGNLDFKDVPLSQIVIAESALGMVDLVIWEKPMTARQIVQMSEREVEPWQLHKDMVKLANQSPDEKCDVLFMVAPRKKGRGDAIDRNALPVAGYYVDKKHNHIMLETGFHEHPLPVARWFKTPVESYGRSPAMMALPDIKTLNVAVRMLMFGIEKALHPNIFLPNDGSMNKVDLSAGGVTFYDAKQGAPVFYNGETDVNAGFAYIQQLQNQIRSMFYVDQLQLAAEANMTATEVLQRQDEKARLLAPAIGRIQTELLGPLVQRSVSILMRNGKIPEPPQKIQGMDFKIDYISPINRAQRALDVQNILEAVTAVAQLGQIDPKAMNTIDLPKAAGEILDSYGVTGLIKRDEQEKEEMEEQQDAATEMQGALAVGEQVANISGALQ